MNSTQDNNNSGAPRGAVQAADDYEGINRILRAVQRGKVEEVEEVFDDEIKDKEGRWGHTPLIWAIFCDNAGTVKIVKFLVGRKVAVEKCDFDGETPLIWAAVVGNTKVVKILLEAEANKEKTDVTDDVHRTPYDYALKLHSDNLELLALLIDKKALDRSKYLSDVSNSVINTASVVAALVLTLAYSMVLSPPGGWAQQTPFGALAVTNTSFKAFIILNAAAFFSALLALVLLLSLHVVQFSWSGNPERVINEPNEQNGREALDNAFIGSALLNGIILLLVSIAFLFSAYLAGPFLLFANQLKFPEAILVLPGITFVVFVLGSCVVWRREKVTQALQRWWKHKFSREFDLMQVRNFKHLAYLVKSGTPKAKQRAATALKVLAWAGKKNEIQDAGGIRPLVDLLKPINPADKKILNNDIKNAMEIAQEMAAGAIANLTHHGITLTQQGACEKKAPRTFWRSFIRSRPCVQDEVVNAKAIQPLVVLLKSGSGGAKRYAAAALAYLAKDNTSNQEEMLASGATIPAFVELLKSGVDDTVVSIARILESLARSSSANQAEIAREGVILHLVSMLRTDIDGYKESAANALRAQAMNSNKNKAEIAREGGIPPLVSMLQTGTDEFRESASNALRALAMNNDKNKEDIKAAVDAISQALSCCMNELFKEDEILKVILDDENSESKLKNRDDEIV